MAFARVASGFTVIAGIALFAASPASAATVTVEGIGRVATIDTLRGAATGSVVVGDTLRFRFSYDTAASALVFSGGPNFQVYSLPMTGVSATVGGYTLTPDTTPGTPPVILLGTGFALLPPPGFFGPVFNQSFIIPGTGAGNLPFAVGADGGATLSIESRFAQDLTGITPTPANLRDPYEAFRNRFSLAVGDGQGTVGVVAGEFIGGFVAVAAVPEPATWMMLIVGFGMIGAGMRGSEGRSRAVAAA